ncbi:MAG: thioredoxin family protein [Anaerolineaceae bacterium]
MIVEVLYIDGCPNFKRGLFNLKQALADEQIQAEIRMQEIEDDLQADNRSFLGSPSFQVNGQDLWPVWHESYHLGCRVYSTPAGLMSCPSVDMLREKLRALS